MSSCTRFKALLFAAALIAGAGAMAVEVTVFAAASLTDALQAIAPGYEKQSGNTIVFNFAGSGTLVRQIEAGAPADVFFSADEAKADRLAERGLLVDGARKSLVGNTLVIVAAKGENTIAAPSDLTNTAIRHVAIGDVKVVPAGSYARTYLDTLGLWPLIEPKAIPCESVRAVLGAVEAGNAEAGLVYKTDAAISRKVRIAYEVPASDGPGISYPLALLKNAPEPEAAKKFLVFLESSSAKEIFEKFGFIMLPQADKK